MATSPVDTDSHNGLPLLTAAIGAFAALASHELVTIYKSNGAGLMPTSWVLAAAHAILTAAAVLIVAIRRASLGQDLAFAGVCALAAGLTIVWLGHALEPWRLVGLYGAVAVATILYLVSRDADASGFPYVSIYEQAWRAILILLAAMAFLLLSVAVGALFTGLFGLAGLGLTGKADDRFWFALIGAGLGAGAGIMRVHPPMMALLQNLVAMVLRVLAPVLAAGLVLFLFALPFSGLDSFWRATRSATPILLACMLGAFVLANVVVAGRGRDAARSPILKLSALALTWIILPLAVLAAIATGQRVMQHGLTPDRLAAITLVAGAATIGVAYLGAILWARLRWADAIRRINRPLVFATGALALFVALPLNGFYELATRDQVGRLTRGDVSPSAFDWAALRNDFGAPGRRAVKALSEADDAEIRKEAQHAMQFDASSPAVRPAPSPPEPRILPKSVELPQDLRQWILGYQVCANEPCTVLYSPGAAEAITLRDRCVTQLGSSQFRTLRECMVTRGALDGREWVSQRRGEIPRHEIREAVRRALEKGELEVRPVQRRQLFIGDQPVGEAFE